MADKKLITFFDTIGRTIIGELVASTQDTIKVKNPVIVHIMPNPQTGNMNLQLFPAFFKEFLADKNADTVWQYNRDQITLAEDITYDFRLTSQYNAMFSPIILPKTDVIAAPAIDKTVKLFGDGQ